MNNKSGGGSGTNVNGGNFEKESLRYIRENLEENNYKVKPIDIPKLADTEEIYSIYKGETIKGVVGTQNSIFKWLNIEENFKTIKNDFIPTETLKEVWSKDLEPDIVLISFGKETVIRIFECKYQNAPGSVDEKIQTAIYKKELWVKLFKQVLDSETNIHYHYLLSNWFEKESKKIKKQHWTYNYENVFVFLKKNNFSFFINEMVDWDEKDVEYKVKNKKGEVKIKTRIKASYKKHHSSFKDLDGKAFNPSEYIK